MAGLNPGNGYTFERGLNGLSLDILPQPQPKQQFQVQAQKSGNDWYLSIQPGWVQRPEYTVGITSSGNRVVSAGFTDISDSSTFARLVTHEITKVNCHKGLRFPAVANDLKLGQQYLCPENETLVILYAPTPGSGARIAVIGKDAYNNTFNYAGTTDEWGFTAVVQVRSGSDVTVTKDGNGKVTDVSLSFDSVSYWERIGLLVRPLAKFNKTTRELTIYNLGPQTFDHVSETYAVDVDIDDVTTAPSVIDANWAAAFYNTGDANGPSGYTFDY